MNLLNLMYRYINRFINGEELIIKLKEIDKEKCSDEERKEIDLIIDGVKKILDTVPNEIDDIEKNRQERIDSLLEKFDNMEFDDSEALSFMKKQKESLEKDKIKIKDGGKRYEEIFNLLTKNKYINDYSDTMNALETLDFITQYISVPLPPVLTQEGFDEIVEAGIKNNKLEAVWRMAVNYNCKRLDFTKIEDYFIRVRDSYYLTELLSAVPEDLDRDSIIKKVLDTKDSKFIEEVAQNALNISLITQEEIDKIKENYRD